MADLKDLTKEQLIKLYYDDLLTDREIAKIYDTYQVKISRLRKKWDILTLGKTGRIEASLPDLTNIQKELLIGSLMGDGGLTAPSELSARFAESHSEKQEDYLRWKVDILGDYVSSTHPTRKVTENKTYRGYGFATQSCTQLRPYYDMFYPAPDRVRKFPSNLPDLITPFSLAVWYLDDGRLANRFHPQIIFGLDDESLHVAMDSLRILGFSPQISEPADGTCIISFPAQSDMFFDLVGAHIPDCMSYKLPEESERREQDRVARQLDPETARTLYDGGMSCTDIARLYNTSRATAYRRVCEDGSPSRMGRPRKSYSRRSAKVALENYDTSLWADLDSGEQQRWIDDIYAVLVKTPFPYPRPYEGDEAQKSFKKLVDKEIYVTEDREIRPKTPFGIRLCDGYFPSRYRAQYKNKKTCYEGWFNEKLLRRAIKIQLKGGDPVIPYRVRKAVQYQLRTPTIFRPGVAKYIYQTYGGEGTTTWDPCAGYGGRMLGALATGTHYIGTDVEEETIEGNQRLASTLGLEAKVTLHCTPAETFEVPTDIDVVFTSPPYFDREKYSESEDQSWVKHGSSDLDGWLEGFLRPVILKAHKALKDGGTFAMNICDLNDNRGNVVPLESEMFRLAIGEGLEPVEMLKMPLSNLSPRAYEPIFIFKKP